MRPGYSQSRHQSHRKSYSDASCHRFPFNSAVSLTVQQGYLGGGLVPCGKNHIESLDERNVPL